MNILEGKIIKRLAAITKRLIINKYENIRFLKNNNTQAPKKKESHAPLDNVIVKAQPVNKNIKPTDTNGRTIKITKNCMNER